MNQLIEVDAVVVGAGPVGIVTALLLAKKGIRCVLLEKNHPLKSSSNKHENGSVKDYKQGFDGRTLALNIESERLLSSIDCLPEIELCEEIQKIRVTQQGHFGSCLLESEQEYLQYFGLTVNSTELGEKMQQSLLAEYKKDTYLQYFESVKINDIRQDSTIQDEYPVSLSIGYKEGKESVIHTKILIAADGTNSQVRQHFDFPTTSVDYQQIATLTKVTHQKKHLNIAHERFLKNGVLALLPTAIKTNHQHLGMQSGFVSSVVWLQNNVESMDTKALSEEELLRVLQKRFGEQYGKFIELTPVTNYAMREIVATQTHHQNIILIGNAAHSLHPVAGQGLNLGLKDVQQLLHHIGLTGCTQESLRNFSIIQKKNVSQIQCFVNKLLEGFSSFHPMSVLSRSLLMIAFEKCAVVRRPLLYQLSGVQEPAMYLEQIPTALQNKLERIKRQVDKLLF